MGFFVLTVSDQVLRESKAKLQETNQEKLVSLSETEDQPFLTEKINTTLIMSSINS